MEKHILTGTAHKRQWKLSTKIQLFMIWPLLLTEWVVRPIELITSHFIKLLNPGKGGLISKGFILAIGYKKELIFANAPGISNPNKIQLSPLIICEIKHKLFDLLAPCGCSHLLTEKDHGGWVGGQYTFNIVFVCLIGLMTTRHILKLFDSQLMVGKGSSSRAIFISGSRRGEHIVYNVYTKLLSSYPYVVVVANWETTRRFGVT